VTDSPTSKIRWLLIFWMFVVSAIAYLDRVNISIAGTAIASEFHLDDVRLGFVFSAFVAGYALFQVPGGAIADRLGPRLVLGLGVIWWAIFTTLITFVSAGAGGLIFLLMAVRFFLGIGEAVVYPASNCIVSSWIPSVERGVANGIIFAGVGFGTGLTPPIVAYLTHVYGWRSAFWASAGLGLVAGAVWYVIARDKPSQHPWISRAEVEHIETGLPAPAVASAGKVSLAQVLAKAPVWLITFSYFAYGYVAYIFFTWFYIYLNKARHLDLKQSTVYTMIPPLAMMAGSTLGGIVSDNLSKKYGNRVGRCYVAFAAIALCATLLAFGSNVASAQIASLILAAGAGALYVSQSAFWSMSADLGRNAAGSVSGFMNMGGQFGGVVTASLTPALADRFGWPVGFETAAAIAAAGALVWLLVKPEEVRAAQAVAAH
jgi:ACS family glucarate transporter-like MFS transporter